MKTLFKGRILTIAVCGQLVSAPSAFANPSPQIQSESRDEREGERWDPEKLYIQRTAGPTHVVQAIPEWAESSYVLVAVDGVCMMCLRTLSESADLESTLNRVEQHS